MCIRDRYCGDMWGRYCCLTIFFPIVDTCLSCEDIARQNCAMVRRLRIFGDFLRPVFSASRLQHVSDLHSKFALRSHNVWKYSRYKKKPQGKNIMFASATQGGHNNANIVRERRTMHNATMWHEITVIIWAKTREHYWSVSCHLVCNRMLCNWIWHEVKWIKNA